MTLGVYQNAQRTLNTHVTRAGEDRTQVQVVSSIKAFEYNMTGQWYEGYSTGKVERLVLDGIATKLSPKAPSGKSEGL